MSHNPSGTSGSTSRASAFYPWLFRVAITKIDPERAHHLTVDALRLVQCIPGGLAVLRSIFGRGPVPPSVKVAGMTVQSRFGLGAGFDKDAQVIPALMAIGFGHVEVGTITAQPQPGNPKPRAFRLVGDRALINRMGFNNDGARVVAKRLAELRRSPRGREAVVGVNIGKSKVTALDRAAEDYATSARLLAPYASYLAVNVSSPNTPGLRELQAIDQLREILLAVMEQARGVGPSGRDVPVFVKIAPDLHDRDVLEIADLARELGLAGVIAANTTISRPRSLLEERHRIEEIGAGGLSGPVLASRSEHLLTMLRNHVGQDLTLISVGGVETPEQVTKRLEAGADLVQGYTGLIYEGPSWPGRIARALARAVA
ncbi:quinone-dependent dihydroorotate dehydrogenase [Devriesea agamarum]|uniref:quinone-dependent dihydroorotate dehydrogenase n=1 Tax=Devriesea agamarum TaxID=472569 RepID=UPI00071D0B71